MVDVNKQTNTLASMVNKVRREMRDNDTARNVLCEYEGMESAVKYMAERFNGMRAQLAAFCNAITKATPEARAMAEAIIRITHGDFGIAQDEDGETVNFDVEDAGGFANTVSSIMSRISYVSRMKSCVAANAKIAESIESWKSKKSKMEERLERDGSSDNERAVAERKIIVANEAIDILRKRGSEVSSIFHETKRLLQSRMAALSEDFVNINYNEKA